MENFNSTNVQIFSNEQFGDVRVIFDEKNNPLFIANDVAKSLGYSNTRDALNRHCKNIVKHDIPTNGGIQQMSVIPETDVYRLIMRSKLPEAEKFQDWVTGEVLPSIRKHGMYATEQTVEKMLSDPDTAIKLLSTIKEEREKRKQLESENKSLKPKALFADAVATSDRSYLIGELAKILRQNGIQIGQNRLFEYLRKNGYLCSKGEMYNRPTQKAMDLGLFEIKQTSITKPDGNVLVTTTTKVTGKGQIYFINKFMAKQAA